MRIAAAVLCVLALTGSAEARMLKTETNFCDIKVPKIKEVTVPFKTYLVSQHNLDIACEASAHNDPKGYIAGCTYPTTDGSWVVYALSDLGGADQLSCVVHYEMAHMPPNFWADPAIELPETMKWLADQKAAYFKGRTSP